MDLNNSLDLFTLITVGVLILTVIILLLVFFSRPSSRRDKLRLIVPLGLWFYQKRRNHILLGISEHSKLMAKSLLKDKKSKIIFVNLADTFSTHAEADLRRELGSMRIDVLGGLRPRADEKKLSSSIGLHGLQKWFENKKNSLYIFSPIREDNELMLSICTDDDSIKAKVYFYSAEPDGFESLLASMGSRVRMLNPHQMAFQDIKINRSDLLPVKFVQKAVDSKGNPLGYVEKGINALVVGFGNTGQEAVRFLYEYGSFVGKDLNRAPMSISVIDPLMDSKLGKFLQSAPALKGDKTFNWICTEAGTVKFWNEFDKSQYNYIVIAMDNGPKNIQMAISMLQAAAHNGWDLSKTVILVRIWRESPKIKELIDFYNKSYCPSGVKVIRSFGNNTSTWTPDVVSGRRLKKIAQHFNDCQKDNGLEESWEERKERLSKPGPDFLKNKMELRRRQAIDIARALYVPTFMELVSPDETPSADQMKYHCAQEHLHWMNALEVAGYTNGPIDELGKHHPDMVPYTEIKNEKSLQVNLLAVKSILQMSGK